MGCVSNSFFKPQSSEKTLGLWHNEKLVLEATGLKNEIKDREHWSGRISVGPETLERIQNKIVEIEGFVNKEYSTSFKNRMLYWIGKGEIGEHWGYAHDLKVVLKDLQIPLRLESEAAYTEQFFQAVAISSLFAVFKPMYAYRSPYHNSYTDGQVTPFNQINS